MKDLFLINQDLSLCYNDFKMPTIAMFNFISYTYISFLHAAGFLHCLIGYVLTFKFIIFYETK